MCLSLGGTEVVLVMALCSVFVKVLELSAKSAQVLAAFSISGGQREGTSEGESPTCPASAAQLGDSSPQSPAVIFNAVCGILNCLSSY